MLQNNFSGRSRVLLLVQMALMTALLEVSKLALASIPNVELVSLEIILFTLYLGGLQALFPVFAFILLEAFVWGFGVWTVSYIYTWSLLVLLTLLLRRLEDAFLAPLIFALLSGSFGLCFGPLSSIPYYLAGGLGAAIANWMAGIPYDVVHGISNFFICLFLYLPLHRVLNRIKHSSLG